MKNCVVKKNNGFHFYIIDINKNKWWFTLVKHEKLSSMGFKMYKCGLSPEIPCICIKKDIISIDSGKLLYKNKIVELYFNSIDVQGFAYSKEIMKFYNISDKHVIHSKDMKTCQIHNFQHQHID
jgi:hypothetical protein